MAWRIHFKNRRMEWLVAAYTAIFGAWLACDESSLAAHTFGAALEFMPEPNWALAFTLGGVVHLGALSINGLAWWTPFVRAFAAALNLLAYALLTAGLHQTAPDAASVVTYSYIVASLTMVVFLALRDCFLLRRAWRAQST